MQLLPLSTWRPNVFYTAHCQACRMNSPHSPIDPPALRARDLCAGTCRSHGGALGASDEPRPDGGHWGDGDPAGMAVHAVPRAGRGGKREGA